MELIELLPDHVKHQWADVWEVSEGSSEETFWGRKASKAEDEPEFLT